MSDVFNIPTTDSNVQIFFNINGSGSTNWSIWRKPRNVKYVYILAISGAGGGGGGGATTFGARGGAGGGSSGTLTNCFFLSSTLPDTLYIQVGAGGLGGLGTNGAPLDGNNGGNTYVCTYPLGTFDRTLVYAAGGFGGSGIGSGSATPSLPAVATTMMQSNMGILQNIISYQIGNGGGSSGGGNGPSTSITSFLTGGAGGGGGSSGSTISGNGGNITGSGSYPTIKGGTAGGNLDGGDGLIQLPTFTSSSILSPVLFTAGAGGAASTTTGGKGGNGGYGCGGGGAGVGGISGGNGGKGGDGLVIIVSF